MKKILIYLSLATMLALGSSCNSSQLAIEGGSDIYINLGVI